MGAVRARVAISRASPQADRQAVLAAVSEAVADVGPLGGILGSGSHVVIKPNVFAPLPPPTTTDPRVVSALIELCRQAGAREVTVAEGRSISTAKFRPRHNTTRECCRVTGMAEAVAEAGARLVALEEDEFVEVPLPAGRVLTRPRVARTILEADVLINVPVLKNHSLALVTLGIKNLHGVISDEDKLHGHSYRDLPRKLAELLMIRQPDLTVVDGLRGSGGDHADEGKVIDVGAIIAGRDTVAVDTVAAAVMGIEAHEVETIVEAEAAGLGVADLAKIEVVGVSVESVRIPFPRPDIEISPERFPGLTVYAGDYCRGCQYYVRRGLDRLVKAGLLNPERPLALVLGRDPQVPDRLPGAVVILGDCACESPSVKPLRDHLLLDGRLNTIYACPPMQFRIRACDMFD
jgi:uncharacterized protein (DUF362 family)